MKRTIPLLITAAGGFVLIVAYFIPITQGWGEIAAIWFDILAAIAFVLGGGNLLKIHLKKVSDRVSGWGYSLITLLAFLGMLYVGLVKWVAPPAPNQEYFGETFATLPVEALPDALAFSIPGEIPVRTDGEHLHASVRRQISQEDGRIVFRGWMQGGQLTSLEGYHDHLDWQCTVDRLYAESQPTGVLAGAVAYHANHTALAVEGRMTAPQRDALLAMPGNEQWQAAVNQLFEKTQVTTEQTIAARPVLNPAGVSPDVNWDRDSGTLSVRGPLTPSQRGALSSLFPKMRPMDEAARTSLLQQITSAGPIDSKQEQTFTRVLDTVWTPSQLRDAVDKAGIVAETDRAACDMLADQEAGISPIETTTTIGSDSKLNDAQVAMLAAFARDDRMTVGDLTARLRGAGTLSGSQAAAISTVMGAVPTVGEFHRNLCFELMRTKGADGDPLSLNDAQRDLLLGDQREQFAWQRGVGTLFVASHTVKYPWSGEYRAQGAPFWWLYEYAFKPLQATIFAMLAFYVASAAFRAFRAKNVEAILLLGTAFIILLGRTFAGVYLTAWMPEALSGLKIENLTVTIMKVFNTAGNRAIMIGIALGIASTSLKVLLGVDRSYLGSGEE